MSADQAATGTTAEWDASTYHQVARPHVGWGERILARVPLRGHETVIDAGCGSGLLTEGLLRRLPQGQVIGIDRSATMLREARSRLAPEFGEQVLFVRADLQTPVLVEVADRIVSSATFHWVPDHDRLFAALFAGLKPGGWLIAQCGGGPNIATLRTEAARVMKSEHFAPYFGDWPGPWVFAGPDVTASRLNQVGFENIHTDLETSPQRFADADAYRTFLKTVIFGAHLARLPNDELKDAFLDELTRVAAASTTPFLVDYWRLNIRARRPLPD